MQVCIFDEKGNKITLNLDTNSPKTGGSAIVYPVLSPKKLLNCCVKIYHEKERNKTKKDKLEFLIDNPPQYLNAKTGKLQNALKNKQFILCWPMNIVYDSTTDEFIGYLMKKAPDDSEKLSALTQRREVFSGASSNIKSTFKSGTSNGLRNRLLLCINLMAGIRTLSIANNNNYQFVHLDINPKNFLFNHKGFVSIIDLDNTQITQDKTLLFSGDLGSEGYKPKEGVDGTIDINNGDIASLAWDLFSLSVVFYQILFGIEPFDANFKKNFNNKDRRVENELFVFNPNIRNQIVGIPDQHKRFAEGNDEIKALFHRGLGPDPKNRPSLDEWVSVFQRLIKGIDLHINSKRKRKNTNTKNSSSQNTTASKKKVYSKSSKS